MTQPRFSILVVDDRLNEVDKDTKLSRRESYNLLGDAFDVSFAESLLHFDQLIVERRYDAFLVDFVLSEWGTTAALILARLKDRYPVGLISSFWREKFEELRQALDQHHAVKTLFCWDDLQEEERRGLITSWMTRAIREHRGLSSFAVGPNETLRLLHFSDLQFGGGEPKDFQSETYGMAEHIRTHWKGNGPSFILITGDIAEHGLPNQYNDAQNWIERFVKTVAPNWTKDRMMLIPGNHDICRQLAMAASIDPQTTSIGTSLNRELTQFAFAPFRQFAARLTGDTNWHDPSSSYWVSGAFRHLGLIFFGYNTSETLDAKGGTTRLVQDTQLAHMFDEVRRLKADAPAGCVVVGLVHHPLVPLKPEDALADPTAFYRNMAVTPDFTWVMLTGHVHEGGVSPQDQVGVEFLEIISPTPTKQESTRPSDTLRGFNLIDVDRQNDIPIRLTITKFEFSGFTIVPRNKLVFERPEGQGPFRRPQRANITDGAP